MVQFSSNLSSMQDVNHDSNGFLDNNPSLIRNSLIPSDRNSDFRNSISSMGQQQQNNMQMAMIQNSYNQQSNNNTGSPAQGYQRLQTTPFYTGMQTPNYLDQPNNYFHINDQDLNHHQLDDIGNLAAYYSPSPHGVNIQALNFQQLSTVSTNPSLISNQSQLSRPFGNNSNTQKGLINIPPNYSAPSPQNLISLSQQQNFNLLNHHYEEQHYIQNQSAPNFLGNIHEIQRKQDSFKQEHILGSMNSFLDRNSSTSTINNQAQIQMMPFKQNSSPENQQQRPPQIQNNLTMFGIFKEERPESVQSFQMQQTLLQQNFQSTKQTHLNGNQQQNQRDSIFGVANEGSFSVIQPEEKNVTTTVIIQPNQKENHGIIIKEEEQVQRTKKEIKDFKVQSKVKKEQSSKQVQYKSNKSRLNLQLDFKEVSSGSQNCPVVENHPSDYNQEFIHSYRQQSSFSKFDYSPQYQSVQSLIHPPLSPSDYDQNQSFSIMNEEKSQFYKQSTQFQQQQSEQIKAKQQSSNQNFEMTFSKANSQEISHPAFSNMINCQQANPTSEFNQPSIPHSFTNHFHPNTKSQQLPRTSSSKEDAIVPRHSSSGNLNNSQNSFQFCSQCNQEYLRRLLQDEQRKRKELEQIELEKESIINSMALHNHQAYGYEVQQHHQQPAEVLFYCDRVEKIQDNRKIGKLTVTERYMKIKKFKEKKDRRIWKKKISYDCRKQVADKRLRIKGRFIRKGDQKKLLQDIFGNGELFPEDVKQFNASLTQLMSEHQKLKMQRKQMAFDDFLYFENDDKGNKHSFFDFKKFSNFIDDDEEEPLEQNNMLRQTQLQEEQKSEEDEAQEPNSSQNQVETPCFQNEAKFTKKKDKKDKKSKKVKNLKQSLLEL